MKFSEAEKQVIMAQARFNARRADSPSASADDGPICPSAPSETVVVKTIATDPRDLLAAAVPSRRDREIAELESFDRQCAIETERRKLCEQHRQRAASASAELEKLEKLHADVLEVSRAANEFANAIIERVEAMAAEIAKQACEIDALRGRLERGLAKHPREQRSAAATYQHFCQQG
jgi:hypothetical protein